MVLRFRMSKIRACAWPVGVHAHQATKAARLRALVTEMISGGSGARNAAQLGWCLGTWRASDAEALLSQRCAPLPRLSVSERTKATCAHFPWRSREFDSKLSTKETPTSRPGAPVVRSSTRKRREVRS